MILKSCFNTHFTSISSQTREGYIERSCLSAEHQSAIYQHRSMTTHKA